MTDRMKIDSSCDGKPFVLKPVSRSIFDLLQEFKEDFGNNPRLRIHVDDNKKENVLVYEYFKSDLLSLIEKLSSPSDRGKKDNSERGWARTERYSYNALDTLRFNTIKVRLPLSITLR